MQCRIISGRLVHHTDKRSALFYSKIRRFFRKECLSRSPDSISTAAEKYSIQIHIQNFILRIIALQFHGRNPLFQLYPHHLDLRESGDAAGNVRARIQCLRKLLSDGAAASLTGIAQEQSFHRHTSKALKVNAGVLVEPHVLSSHGCLNKIWRQIFVRHIRSVLYMKSGKDLSVISNHLRSELTFRAFQFLERRNISEKPYSQQHHGQQNHRTGNDYPEPFHKFLSRILGHNYISLVQNDKITQKIWKIS